MTMKNAKGKPPADDGKPIYQGNLFGKAEIVSGDLKKTRGRGSVRRKVIATKVTWKTWAHARALARAQGVTVSTLVEKLLSKAK